jgi:hypothetical protein
MAFQDRPSEYWAATLVQDRPISEYWALRLREHTSFTSLDLQEKNEVSVGQASQFFDLPVFNQSQLRFGQVIAFCLVYINLN